MQRENEKEERLERARSEEKAVAEAQVEKVYDCPNFVRLVLTVLRSQVKQAFLDDRKSKMLADERERQRLAAKAAKGPNPPPETESPPPPYIPGGGFTLTGDRVPTPEPEDEDEDDEDHDH